MINVRAYLELVRVPNLFTAAADVLAGYLTVAAPRGTIDGQILTWLVVSTVCLYGGGVVLNDYFDEPVDRLERPERPIPSGRVSKREARRLAVGLFVFAALAAYSVGPVSLGLAMAIALAAGFYDAVGKRTAFGPLNMGFCRFLNLLLGVSAAPWLIGDRAILALILMVHITGVTILSRGEVWGGQRTSTYAMTGALATAVLSLLGLGATGSLTDSSYLVFLAVFVLVVSRPLLVVFADPSPRNVGQAVKWGVLGLVLLDATFAAAYGGPLAGLAVAALLLPSTLIARLFAVT